MLNKTKLILHLPSIPPTLDAPAWPLSLGLPWPSDAPYHLMVDPPMLHPPATAGRPVKIQPRWKKVTFFLVDELEEMDLKICKI